MCQLDQSTILTIFILVFRPCTLLVRVILGDLLGGEVVPGAQRADSVGLDLLGGVECPAGATVSLCTRQQIILPQ
jgi:hypothetical protein